MSFSRGLKARAGKIWEDGYNHPFVQELGQGTLSKETFQFYLLQDYQYLKQYAKVFAAGVMKAEDEVTMRRMSDAQHMILATEMDLHRKYMAEFGVSVEEMDTVKASLFNRCYTSNMLAVAQTGGIAEIIATLFPCGWTYADYGTRLKAQYADRLEGNFFKSWIEMYASEAFALSFEWFYDALDALVANKTQEEKARIEEIFISSVEFEYLFWDMAYKRAMSY